MEFVGRLEPGLRQGIWDSARASALTAHYQTIDTTAPGSIHHPHARAIRCMNRWVIRASAANASVINNRRTSRRQLKEKPIVPKYRVEACGSE
ncbi:MAG: hypothetical protein FWD57_12835 [Polyangiaceae bacterium]|nr:hypothetical protein [Polyangiaceae bacterium]